ncbi:MAG TPA: hypothetical protein VFW90_01950 [Candidatus Saccharimonadales bacterium]|nr:hypothetical protein [Candidatus Saccharimonadales bacterium]
MVRGKVNQASLAAEGGSKKSRSNGSIFILAFLDMSWRLAIVVLVPIIGGFELDKHLGTTPALVILGFLIAMLGVFVTLKRTLVDADRRVNSGRKR